ncbi:MAG: hypothetical protein ACI3ZB_02595 [Prevotella sp.]
MPDNIKPKDDALRQVMRRRKERRPSMELPKEVEDRVMERICAPDKVKSEERRVKSEERRVKNEERRVKSEERRVKNQNVFLLAQLYDSSLFTLHSSFFTLRSSLSILRPLIAAAAIACILVLAETMIPEKQKEDISAIVAKVEIHQPVEPGTNTKREHPQTSVTDTQIASLKKRGLPPKTEKADKIENVAHDPIEKTEVCINCELDAMADELTAMINEFENQ